MQSVSLPYGKSCLQLDIEGCSSVHILEQKAYVPEFTDDAETRRALSAPIRSSSLRELARDKKNVLIVTNDITRPMPSMITIPALIDEIRCGNLHAEITIIIASGLHRAMTKQELIDKMGEDIVSGYHIIVHDAYSKADLAYFGELSSGNPLWLNKELLRSDLVIAEGFIEAHWLAGFSGGRKSIMPGIAGADTVMNNHNPDYVDNVETRPGNMKNNMAHGEFIEAAEMAKLAFILNVVLDKDKKIIKAFAGHPISAHEEGCKFVEELMSAPCELSDITIVTNGGFPLDLNLYQSCKGLNTASYATKENGVIIMCTHCREGVGHGGFADVMNMKLPPDEILRRLHCGDISIYDQWGAQVILNVLKKFKVILVTEIDRDIIEGMGIMYAESIKEAFDMAKTLSPDIPSVNVIPEGPVIIPKKQEK